MENITVTVFKVESEAYQALSKMRKHAEYQESLKFSQVALLKKSNNQIHYKDGFDTGIITRNDTWKGGLIGGLLGFLGGPLGLLLGMGVGTVAGVIKDSYDFKEEVSVIKFISSRMIEGNVAIISTVVEENEELYDRMMSEFESITIHHEIQEVEKELEHAEEVEKKLQKQANEEMENRPKDK